jgi:hypothetical protein
VTRDQAISVLEQVEKVQVASLGPSDVLVLTLPGLHSRDSIDRIHTMMKQVWPDNKCIVLDEGASLRVVSECSP